MAQPRFTKPKTTVKTLPLDQCLAKTRLNSETSTVERGCTVEAHLEATYWAAKELLALRQKYRSGSLFPPEVLLAPLLHDIGKLNPGFQDKIYRAAFPNDNNRESLLGFAFPNENHALASRMTFYSGINTDEFPWFANLADVVASHHGINCQPQDGTRAEVSDWLGKQPWQAMRISLARTLCERFKLILADLPVDSYENPDDALELYKGLTTVADWLASAEDIRFGDHASEAQMKSSVKEAGFVPFQVKEGMSFEDVFRFTPRPLQQKMATHVHPGGVYVLEMEMGGGKTEAALYLAYQLLAKYNHDGIYFALPTQLTSDQIHKRFTPFLKTILSEGQPDRQALLLHGRAWLNDHLAVGEGTTGCEPPQIRNSWFDQRKRGLLAPFAVGTIDQLLMAAINVRHNFVRAFGIAGKVVILDEIHSYDAYTGTLIENLIRQLRHWGCTVILLSATLTSEMRSRFLDLVDEPAAVEKSYPLLSIRHDDQTSYYPIPSTGRKKVEIHHSSDVTSSLDRALAHARQGESVLWIENTVRESQETFRQLAARAEETVEVGLIHSAFQTRQRTILENRWTSWYGKQASPEERRRGKILVGTQILEQSLDIDADFLFTRLCPTDMLLQRIGRLWRHRSNDPFRPESARCQVEIINPDPFVNKADFSRRELKSYVYDKYILVRSQEIFDTLTEVVLPDQIRPLLEQTYTPRQETDFYQALKETLETEREKLHRMANLASGNGQNTLDDIEGLGTRYVDEPMVELLMVEDWLPDQRLLKLFGWSKYLRIPDATSASDKVKRLNLVRKLYKCFVRTRITLAPVYEEFRFISDFLPVGGVHGKEENRPIRFAFIDTTGQLLNESKLPIKVQQRYGSVEEYMNVFYDERIGLYHSPGGR